MFQGVSFAKTLQGHKSHPVTMLQARPHAIHFKRILDFGEGQLEEIVRSQVGHADVSVTDIYSSQDENTVRAAVEGAGLGFNLA